VNSKFSWTQVETGSAITWKYPSVLLIGDSSVGDFYSVAVVNNYQQADTGTKDDSHREKYEEHNCFERNFGGTRTEFLSRISRDEKVVQ